MICNAYLILKCDYYFRQNILFCCYVIADTTIKIFCFGQCQLFYKQATFNLQLKIRLNVLSKRWATLKSILPTLIFMFTVRFVFKVSVVITNLIVICYKIHAMYLVLKSKKIFMNFFFFVVVVFPQSHLNVKFCAIIFSAKVRHQQSENICCIFLNGAKSETSQKNASVDYLSRLGYSSRITFSIFSTNLKVREIYKRKKEAL